MNKLIKLIMSRLSNEESLLKLSLSFLSCGLLFTTFSFLSESDTNGYTAKLIYASFCYGLFILTFPYVDRSTKDKFISKMGKGFIVLLLGLFATTYWTMFGIAQKVNMLFDFIFTVITIYVFFHIISLFYLFIKAMFSIIKKINDKDSKPTMQIILERLTAFFLAITAFTASIIGIIKPIIEMLFKR